MISDNLKSVTKRIAKCCERSGRPEEAVKLVSVTKEADIEEMRAAILAGVTDIGENRVQDAVFKHKAIGDSVIWHLIGHLQTNKAKDAVRIFSLIHSVDSIRIAEAIDKEARKIGKVQEVLVQVNTSGESTKFGVHPEDVDNILRECALYGNIDIKGFMTIAPETSNPETVRPYFRALNELRGRIRTSRGVDYGALSMGMTGDFEVAIEEGATIIRIGRAIFV
ncbi:MAG: YggS family pyridoxal phosphate-dependent enzyme [Candidatus Omnitrophica bacterium]|nr:YggS family pyridoxal phosphate-dependent enzyme [Candidatus Omnitrophota bacterium]